MHPLITLVFPDTVMAPQTAVQLLLFFEKIYHYLPAEPPASGKTGPPPATDPCVEAGLCRGYPPVPIGEGLDRFWKTIRDLRTNVNDYGHRLPFLSLASQDFRDSSDRDEKTVSALLGRLHAGRPDSKPADCGPDLETELWKARIVLQLAEGLETIEEEIKLELAGLEDREQEMLSALKGEDGEAEEEMLGERDLGTMMPEQSSIITSWLKAWSRLFWAEQAAGTAPADQWLATTTSPEAVQLLFDAYVTRFKQEPVRLCALPLPSILPPASVVLERRAAFYGMVAEPRLMLHQFLYQIATAAEAPSFPAGGGSAVTDAISAWSAALAAHLGPCNQALDHLAFYCFPQLTLPALFELAFPYGSSSVPVSIQPGRHAIIAVLERGGNVSVVR